MFNEEGLRCLLRLQDTHNSFQWGKAKVKIRNTPCRVHETKHRAPIYKLLVTVSQHSVYSIYTFCESKGRCAPSDKRTELSVTSLETVSAGTEDYKHGTTQTWGHAEVVKLLKAFPHEEETECGLIRLWWWCLNCCRLCCIVGNEGIGF